MDSVKLVDTAVVYLRTSLAEPIHGRAAFLQSWQRLGSQQQCTNLHCFRAPLMIPSRKWCSTFQPSRSFNSSADYARLGLPTMASRAEIKSAYFSLAKKLHPDNGGDAGRFNEVTEAYKRLMHDTQYVDGVNGDNRQHDPWRDEIERQRRTRMWMEQRMMEEQMRRRRQRMNFEPGFNFGESHRNDPEREEAMKLFFRSNLFRLFGAFIVLQLLVSAWTPSGCPQYGQGCSCKKCMSRESYMRRLGGAHYNRLGHPRACECHLCIALYNSHLQHNSDGAPKRDQSSLE